MCVFSTYKKFKNYTKCIQMIMESHMLLLMYFLLYKEPLHFCFLNFFINNSAIFRSISQRRKLSGLIFHTQKISRWIYMKDLFIIIIFVTMFDLYFLKMVLFWHIVQPIQKFQTWHLKALIKYNCQTVKGLWMILYSFITPI